jgi:hypothetical protein
VGLVVVESFPLDLEGGSVAAPEYLEDPFGVVLLWVQQLELLFVQVSLDLARVPVQVDVRYLRSQKLNQRHRLVFLEFLECHERRVRLHPGFTLRPLQFEIYLFVFLQCTQNFHWDVVFKFTFDFHFLLIYYVKLLFVELSDFFTETQTGLRCCWPVIWRAQDEVS